MDNPAALAGVVLILLLCTGSPAAADGPTNPGFETGLDGWRAQVTGAASVAPSNTQPASGKGCVLLRATAAERATLTSETDVAVPDGDGICLRARVRHLSGTAGLWLGLRRSGADTPDISTCAGQLFQPFGDTRWHTAVVAVIAPPDVCLQAAFAVSGEGEWAVDDVEVLPPAGLRQTLLPRAPGTEPPVAETAVFPEPLEPGWDPGGNLDARERRVLNQTELLLDVGGIAVSIPSEVDITRGSRSGIVTYCANRGTVDKELSITVQGPPDVRLPVWRIPVAAKRSMQFRVPVQRLLLDDCRLKLTFAVKDEAVSAPVLVHTRPAYPTTGLSWASADALPTADELIAAARGGLGLHALPPSTEAAAVQALLAADGGACEYLLHPADGAVPALDASMMTPEGAGSRLGWAPHVAAEATAEQKRAALWQLAGLLFTHHYAPNLHSPRLGLVSGENGAGLRFADEQWAAAVDLQGCAGVGADASLKSLVVAPPALPGATVLGATLDGTPFAGPASYWTGVNAGCDLSGVRTAATEAGLDLPLSVSGLSAMPSGDRRIDALKLARAMTAAFYARAGAVLLDASMATAADDPVMRMAQVLSAELSGSEPVVALGATETMSPRSDALVTYMPFLRGEEGILVIYNNSLQPLDVAVGLRSQPATVKCTRLCRDGEFVRTEFMHTFRLSERAKTLAQPGIYMWLDPLDVTIVTMRLADPYIGWTRGVFDAATFKVEAPARDRGPQWWERLFY